jgi:hypothetical protein
MTYTTVNPHACCNRPRPEDAHTAARPPPNPHASPHLTNSDGLRWKTDGRPPANGPPTATPQPIHTSPGPTQTPHTPTEPTAAATTQPKPSSSSHYGTEFSYCSTYYSCVYKKHTPHANSALLFHTISARHPKQPRMVGTFLKVHTRPRLAYALLCRGY